MLVRKMGPFRSSFGNEWNDEMRTKTNLTECPGLLKLDKNLVLRMSSHSML